MIVEQFKIVYFEPFNSVFSVVISSNDSFYQVGPLLFRYFRLTNDETKPTLNWIVVVVAVNFHRIIRVIYSYRCRADYSQFPLQQQQICWTV